MEGNDASALLKLTLRWMGSTSRTKKMIPTIMSAGPIQKKQMIAHNTCKEHRLASEALAHAC